MLDFVSLVQFSISNLSSFSFILWKKCRFLRGVLNSLKCYARFRFDTILIFSFSPPCLCPKVKEDQECRHFPRSSLRSSSSEAGQKSVTSDEWIDLEEETDTEIDDKTITTSFTRASNVR